jgi:hypothetical protein
MKVSLFQLLVICCIVSVAACEKEKVHSKRGKILGGTFISPNDLSVDSKTMQVKRGNINGGSFVGGAFNFQRSIMTESKRSDDKEKRGNINGGSFVGGAFKFKRSNMTESKKLLPILPNDFTGVIHLKPGLAIGSGSTIGLNVSSFQHTYKFEKFMIYSMVELKTKEERRNVLVEAEKKRRHGLKEGKKGLEMGANSVKEAINMVSRFKTALPKGFKI